MVYLNTHAARIPGRYNPTTATINPRTKHDGANSSFAMGGVQERKWGADSTTRRDTEDRMNLRMSHIERKIDSLESTVKTGAIALIVIGVSVAAYQNWDAIQGGLTRAWQSVPTAQEIKTAVTTSTLYEKFLKYFRA